MRAIVYDRPESFRLSDIPVLEPGPGQVRIRIDLAGVCATDLHLHHGEFAPSYPLTPGHEFVGTLEALGPEVGSAADVGPGTDSGAGLRMGQQVVADTLVSCGGCPACREGRDTFCVRASALGVNAPGAFAEYVVVPARQVFVVDDLEPEVAVFAEPLACVVHGMDVLDLRPGSDVLVFGAGPTGLLLAQLLGPVAGRMTVAAPSQFKLDLAAKHGADHTVRVDRSDPASATADLHDIAPQGFDVVVDATGAVGVLDQTIALTRDAGTVFVYGMAPQDARWSISPYEVFHRELTIKGSFAQHHSFSRAVEALRRGQVRPSDFITHRFGLDHYDDVLGAIGDSGCLKAVLDPRG